MAVASIQLFGAKSFGYHDPIQASQALLFAPSNRLGADVVQVAEAFRACAPGQPNFPKALEAYKTALALGDAFTPPLLAAHWALVDAIHETSVSTWRRIVAHVETTAPWVASASWLVTSQDPLCNTAAWGGARGEDVRALLQAFDTASATIRAELGFESPWVQQRYLYVDDMGLLSAEEQAQKLGIGEQHHGRLYGLYPCLEYLRRGKAKCLAGDVGAALYEVTLGTIHATLVDSSNPLIDCKTQLAAIAPEAPGDRTVWYDRLVNVVDRQYEHMQFMLSREGFEHNREYRVRTLEQLERLKVQLRTAGPEPDHATYVALRQACAILPTLYGDTVDPFYRVALQAIAPTVGPSLMKLMEHLNAVEALIRSLFEGRPQKFALQRIGTAKQNLQDQRATVTVRELLQIEKSAANAGVDNLASRAREAVTALYAAHAPGIGHGPPGG